MVNIALFIVAQALYLVFAPIGFLYAVPRMLTRMNLRAAFRKLSNYFLAMAVAIDQKGNVIMQELFNDLLIKDRAVQSGITDDNHFETIVMMKTRFGNPDETISSVLGKNKRNGTLTTTGKVLDWILNKLDPNHSIKSIEDDESHTD